ncbi:MAG: serine/threonine protein kinase [Candidatus Zhuqueibacterota bacterium]
MPLLHDGQRIHSNYEVERFLGEGAFAEVYRVKHRFFGRQAMKVFKTKGLTLKETEDMLGEAILLSRIEHPNVIRVFDANTTATSEGDWGFFTMEYIAGGSLEQYWRSFGDRMIPIKTTVDIVSQICRGLAVAHREKPPIIHRDIKPQNILIGYDEDGLKVKVSDFGLAKRVNPLTLLASAKGTRCFKGPEIRKDYQSDSCAGDVWAIGCILYLLLTDRLPYPEMNDFDLFDGKCFENPVILPSRLNILVDPALDQLVNRALSIDPKKRYSNAKEMLDELSRWKPADDSGNSKKLSSSQGDGTKTALGLYTPANKELAYQMAHQAIRMVKQANKLKEGADLLEEALNKWPDLREKYEYRLQQWRRGFSTE